jgi:hypothetical protein
MMSSNIAQPAHSIQELSGSRRDHLPRLEQGPTFRVIDSRQSVDSYTKDFSSKVS